MKTLLRNAYRYGVLNLGPVSEAFYGAAKRYVLHYKNFNYDPEANGEYFLLRQSPDIRIAFDVGANRGDWAIACATRCKAATVHAFELVPSTFETLQTKIAGHANIIANPFGLSDSAGEVDVQVHPDPNESYLSSMLPGGALIHKSPFVTRRGRVETGDDYCRTHGIERIDFLKIDVEGAEGHVLRGFKTMLAENRIAVIQFEYGQANIFSRFMLYDAYEMLTKLGYAVGKLFPRGVRFRAWQPEDEDYLGPNYVAVPTRFPEVMARLSLR
jgi:FkbM family methyltransferase